MLEQFIKNRIIAQLPFEANEGQVELLDKLSQFIISPTPRKAFILRGYAGTGKTSIMAALVGALQQLQQRIVLLAPTGRAAKVLLSAPEIIENGFARTQPIHAVMVKKTVVLNGHEGIKKIGGNFAVISPDAIFLCKNVIVFCPRIFMNF